MAFFNSNALKKHPLIRRFPQEQWEWLVFLDAWDDQVVSAAVEVTDYIACGQTAYDTGTGFYLEYNDGTPRFSFGNAAGDKVTWDGTNLSITGSITASTGTIGGWTIGATDLSSGSVSLDSSAEQFLIGAASAPLTGVGIFIGKDGADYEFRAGDPAGNYAHWDGSTLTVIGSISGSIDATDLTGTAPIGTTNIATQGWTISNTSTPASPVFSATDADTVTWTACTITTADGTAYASIATGNTGNMTARTYIYFDSASPTALQTTTTASTAVGSGKILVAVAEDGTDEAFFQVFGGFGGTLITTNELAANAVTANEINVSQLSAVSADMGSLTTGTIGLDSGTSYIKSGQTAYDTGTGFWLERNGGTPRLSIGNSAGNKLTWDGSALAVTGTVTASAGTIGGWTLSANDLSSGNFKINATNEEIEVGSATAPLTGTGIWIGKDGSDYELRVGDPAGDYIHWNGSALTINGSSYGDWGAEQSWTPTWVGFSSAPTGTMYYRVSNDGERCIVYNKALMSGTTSSTGPYISNVPSAIRPPGSGQRRKRAKGLGTNGAQSPCLTGVRIFEASHANAYMQMMVLDATNIEMSETGWGNPVSFALEADWSVEYELT